MVRPIRREEWGEESAVADRVGRFVWVDGHVFSLLWSLFVVVDFLIWGVAELMRESGYIKRYGTVPYGVKTSSEDVCMYRVK